MAPPLINPVLESGLLVPILVEDIPREVYLEEAIGRRTSVVRDRARSSSVGEHFSGRSQYACDDAIGPGSSLERIGLARWLWRGFEQSACDHGRRSRSHHSLRGQLWRFHAVPCGRRCGVILLKPRYLDDELAADFVQPSADVLDIRRNAPGLDVGQFIVRWNGGRSRRDVSAILGSRKHARDAAESRLSVLSAAVLG